MEKNLSCYPPKFEEVPRKYRTPANGRAFYLPIFAVTNKESTRLVFDAAAKAKGFSLNDMLLPGPDRNNPLKGVLLRFRQFAKAFTADVENMFHQFFVPPEERTYMRFFWFKNNNPEEPLVEYWSNVHILSLIHI